MMTWDEVQVAIDDRSKYEVDWDGYGGVPPDAKMVQRTKELAKLMDYFKFPPPKHVVLCSDGNLTFEWYDKHHLLELEINQIGDLEWFGRMGETYFPTIDESEKK